MKQSELVSVPLEAFYYSYSTSPSDANHYYLHLLKVNDYFYSYILWLCLMLQSACEVVPALTGHSVLSSIDVGHITE